MLSLIYDMLRPDPRMRPSIRDVVEHPIVKSILQLTTTGEGRQTAQEHAPNVELAAVPSFFPTQTMQSPNFPFQSGPSLPQNNAALPKTSMSFSD